MSNPPAVDALLDAYTEQRQALRRVLALIACHPDHIATDPAFALRALDTHPTCIAVCPPGCTGLCTETAHPALMARYHALDIRRPH
ncbi:hypothetical protein U5640_36285 [Streptomyces sp. SS7]|uniref:hypothetical protein n=1 Tax=Streptomyces sp. SS7 TaxID=3108485 RepID=UPI0030ED97AB